MPDLDNNANHNANDNDDTMYWVALNQVPKLGTVRFRRLETHFGDLRKAWAASFEELKAAGIDNAPAQEITAARNRIFPEAEMQRMAKYGIQAITRGIPAIHHASKRFPTRLRSFITKAPWNRRTKDRWRWWAPVVPPPTAARRRRL